MSSKSIKIRPVFNALFYENGKPSFCQCLFKGLSLIKMMPDILDRFRVLPIGLSADIEKVFPSVGYCTKRQRLFMFPLPM